MYLFKIRISLVTTLKILLTTSLRPTRRVRTFVKDLHHVIPGTYLVVRGKSNLPELLTFAISNNITKIVIVSTWKGNPGRLLLYQFTEKKEFVQVSPIIYIKGVTLTRELRHYVNKRKMLQKVGYFYHNNTSNTIIELIKSFLRFLELPPAKSLYDTSYDGILYIKPIKNNLYQISVVQPGDEDISLGPIIKGVFMSVPENVHSKSKNRN